MTDNEQQDTTWQQRLQAERLQLAERYEKLDAFLTDPPELTSHDQDQLLRQLDLMGRYLAILEQRERRLG